MTSLRRRLPRLVVTLAILLTIVCGARQLWTTDLGMDERLDGADRTVTEVDPGGPADRAGVAVGDVIVRDPGLITYVVPYTERELLLWNYRLKRAIESGRVPIVVRRDGVEREVEVRPLPAPNFGAGLRQLRRLAPYLPASFAFLAVAALLTQASRRRQPESAAATRARAALALSFACYGPCWMTTWPSPGWPLWLFFLGNAFDVFGAPIATVLLAYFAWTYPTKAAWVDHPWVRSVVIALGAVTSVVAMASAFSVVDLPRALHGNAVSIAFDSAIVVVALVGFAWQRARASTVVARRQSAWLLAGVACATLVPILGLIIPQYVMGSVTPMMHFVLFQFPMIMPLAIAAVVSRYRLFAIDGVASRLGPYAVAAVTSLIVCITVTAAIQMMLGWRLGTMGEASRWTGVIVAIAVGEPLRRASQRLVDRAFSRDRDAFLRRCSLLSVKLARARDESSMEAELAFELEVRHASLVDLEGQFAADTAAHLNAELTGARVLRTRDLVDPAVMDALFERDVELLVSVPSGTSSGAPGKWALLLSAPSFGLTLGRAERDALASIGLVIGAALAQRETQRSLEAEQLRSENERRHIAMELHDGIGATLTAARLMTRRLREPTRGSEHTLEALDATLLRGLGDLRASLWSLDAKDVGWEELLVKVRRAASDMCTAADVMLTMSSTNTAEPSLSSAIRLAILRSVQEAITNAIKHASPRQIVLELRASSDRVDIVVENDGACMKEVMSGGRGLANMHRRIESVFGTIAFTARDGGGTRIGIGIPLDLPATRSDGQRAVAPSP